MTRAIRKHLADFIALTVLFAIGIGVTGYIISQQESRPYIPFLEKSPFKLKAEFSDAQAVIPGIAPKAAAIVSRKMTVLSTISARVMIGQRRAVMFSCRIGISIGSSSKQPLRRS